MPKKSAPVKTAPLTSQKIKHLAGEALKRPSKLSTKQVRELGGSVLRHVNREK